MDLQKLIAAADALAELPPRFAVFPEREKVLLQIDALLSEPDSEMQNETGRFYRMMVDKVLHEVASYNGKTPRLWKLYSSGFILKDRSKVIGLDINDGCIPLRGRTRLLMSVRQTARLAELLDEYYVTHNHEDHVSPRLCDALVKRKKLLVMPDECRRRQLVSGAVAAENFTAPHCRVAMQWQGDASGGIPCAMFLFKLSNGKTLFTRGDIYHKEGFDFCMDTLDKWGERVDFAVMTPYFTHGGEPPVSQLDRKYSSCFLNSHEWEFSHRRMGTAGAATQCFAEEMREFAKPYMDNRAAFVFWGESIALEQFPR